jgi:hypothetical protein
VVKLKYKIFRKERGISVKKVLLLVVVLILISISGLATSSCSEPSQADDITSSPDETTVPAPADEDIKVLSQEELAALIKEAEDAKAWRIRTLGIDWSLPILESLEGKRIRVTGEVVIKESDQYYVLLCLNSEILFAQAESTNKKLNKMFEKISVGNSVTVEGVFEGLHSPSGWGFGGVGDSTSKRCLRISLEKIQ